MSAPFDVYARTQDIEPSPDVPYDEMFGRSGVRPGYELVGEQFEQIGSEELRTRAESLSTAYLDQGVTFDIGGVERPFPLDIMPRLIEPEVWSPIEKGVAQRVRALERFLDDVYGEGAVFADGVIPRQVVLSSPHFHRVVHGLKPPGGVRVHVAGIDLIRDNEGVFRVLEDNVRVPSGVSYVMTNRRAMATALPEVFEDHRIRPVSRYPRQLLAALRATAPAGVADPTVVVLTPGVYNSAYFEHALLARLMGIELVEGRDLVCQGGRVMMRTTRGLEPVHVIYRRVDDEFLDPVHFRSDSLLGVAGLLNAMRVGNVTVANAVGNGVADDKLVYTYVPDLIRYYLSEEPILPNVDTWRMEEPAHREEVMDRLGELVLKPVDGSGGKGIVIGPRATCAELAVLRAQIESNPRGWIAQPVVQLSTHPTLIDGAMRPRHVDLRPFAVNDGQQVWVLPGGLTRVALPEGELIVNSSRGGGSKDTWVLSRSALPVSSGPAVPEPPTTRISLAEIAAAQDPEPGMPPPVEQEPDNAAPVWQEQEQQQQQVPGSGVQSQSQSQGHQSQNQTGGSSC